MAEREKIRAVDIMTPRVVVVSPDSTISQTAKLMNKFRIGGLPVVQDGKLVGIITERCIMKTVIAPDKRPGKFKVKDAMIPGDKLITGIPSETINSLAKKMKDHDISRIPIIDEGGKVVGIVTNKDVIEHGPGLIDIILEQARIKGPLDPITGPVNFGKCEKCGESDDLTFYIDSFLCHECANTHKIESKVGFLRGIFTR